MGPAPLNKHCLNLLICDQMNAMSKVLQGRLPLNALIKAAIALLIAWLVMGLQPVFAQQKYTPAKIHSHNDYAQPLPFYNAFKAGADAIEADVYLRNGVLMVAHNPADIKPELTLKAMYLEPLQKELGKRPGALNLLIDLKERYTTLLPQLIRELVPLLPFITAGNNSPLIIIITGNRPPPAEYNNYPAYILFDDDLQLPHTTGQWKRVAQVSLNFENYSKWKGEGALPLPDERLLKAVINSVHAAGKKIRFWGAPDNAAGWQKLMALNADILCTDKIDELAGFIHKP
jgi:glycerophosphoryl diester phosphodiesterase